MKRESTPIPEPIAQLQRQLEQFRSAQPGRTKLPESLWQAAVELARQQRRPSVAVGLYEAEEGPGRTSDLPTEGNQAGLYARVFYERSADTAHAESRHAGVCRPTRLDDGPTSARGRFRRGEVRGS